MKARVLLIALLPVLAITVVASALGGGQSQLSSVRQATAGFHDVQAAMDAGYDVELPDVFGETCIANLSDPGAGAMGVHLVSLPRVGDPALDAADPEVLVYERRNNGTLKLVAVEYVVFKSDVSSRPSLFGVPFDDNDGSRYGLPPFWALHAWVWKPNPTEGTGIFSQWNPRVTCD
jgi:hypothetical protein